MAVDAGDHVDGLTGILDYSDGILTVLPDPASPARITAGATPRPVAKPSASETTVGYFDLRRFFNDRDDPARVEPVLSGSAYALRLAKTANAICAYARSPAILAVAGIEGLSTLSDLATAANGRAGNILFPDTCLDDPAYRAYLSAGNGGDGLDSGVLVSTAAVRPGVPRVQVLSATQHGKTVDFMHPDGSRELLHERPPLVLRARANLENGESQPLTILVGQWLALDGEEGHPAANGWDSHAHYLRAKRLAQARDLADLIRKRQMAEPGERIVVVGGFNAPAFSDGGDDILADFARDASSGGHGTGRGQLLNMTTRQPAPERYSSILLGNAEARDHIFVNGPLLDAGGLRVEYARINADFGEDNYGDPLVPVRVSDHDVQVLYIADP